MALKQIKHYWATDDFDCHILRLRIGDKMEQVAFLYADEDNVPGEHQKYWFDILSEKIFRYVWKELGFKEDATGSILSKKSYGVPADSIDEMERMVEDIIERLINCIFKNANRMYKRQQKHMTPPKTAYDKRMMRKPGKGDNTRYQKFWNWFNSLETGTEFTTKSMREALEMGEKDFNNLITRYSDIKDALAQCRVCKGKYKK